MNCDLILKNIDRQVKLSPDEADDLCSLLSVRKIKKKEFLLREGDICLYEYFVNQGCFRAYYLDLTGMEHNFYFAVEDWWISDIHSRVYATPSFCNIVALEDAELLQISQVRLEEFLQRAPNMERFFRIAYQFSLANIQLKFLRMFHMSAEERYRYFRDKYPQLDQRIPQKHIASFLGLTPEFFNTVRSKVLRAG